VSNGRSTRDNGISRIILFSADATLVQTARSVLNTNATVRFSVVENGQNDSLADREIRSAALVIADIGSPERKEQGLSDLQNLKSRIGSDLPIIVAVDSFNEVVARLLVQTGVADILVKPVAPAELLKACARVVRTGGGESQIYTFLPVAGGVGNTTLAIQSALTLLHDKDRKNPSTCLVDLNFHHGACADYLDIEARLNLKEIQLNPERLDRQLLEGMVSHHPSGLAVIAAPSLPTEMASETPNVIMGLLNVACQSFDQIVIDMPNVWHSWSDKIVLGSNRLFLVSEATVPSLRKSKQLIQTISANLGDRPQPKVIINRFEWRLFSPGLRRVEFEKALGDAFGCTVPYNHRLVREAIDRGVPINEVQKSSNIAAAIKRLIIPRPAKSRVPPRLPVWSSTPNWAQRGMPKRSLVN
jgi:pilus assembly protein CpaE